MIKIPGDPHGKPGFLCAAVLMLISQFREVSQARIASSRAKPMNEVSLSIGVKYQTPRKKSQLPSFRKLQSCTRKCLRQKSDGTICRLSKSRIPASGRGEDRNTFVNAVEAIIILYQNERNKIVFLLRSFSLKCSEIAGVIWEVRTFQG